uniref:Uncharacterized protein n=1 Tax=Molossus molossus TaxID=27622 RepID=A0A7J8J6I3_MOLMO|nr:hypothetical protein HJG59_009646 [Molossus molossus]
MSWFFEKIHKIDEPKGRLTKKQRGRTQIHKIRKKRGEIIPDTTKIQRIINTYYEQLYGNNFKNLSKMDKFLETPGLPKLNQQEIENLNKPITIEEIEDQIKTLPANKSPCPDGFMRKFYRTFKGEQIAILLKLFQKIQEVGRLPHSFYKCSIILI